MAPRFPKIFILRRPTIGATGDRVVPVSGTTISGAIWSRRLKPVVAGQGELLSITAQGFVPSGTDIARRDQLIVSGTDQRYEVVTVVSGEDDRGRLDHIGFEARDI